MKKVLRGVTGDGPEFPAKSSIVIGVTDHTAQVKQVKWNVPGN